MDRDMPAIRRQGESDCPADTLCRAGYKRDPVFCRRVPRTAHLTSHHPATLTDCASPLAQVFSQLILKNHRNGTLK
jgi:hypothetical protein